MISMIKIIIIILSFILESNLSVYIPLNTNFFHSLLVISSLIIVAELETNNNKFYFISLITGLFYDLLFTNRLGFSLLTFFSTAICIKNINKIIKINFDMLKTIIVIIFYRLISYLILLLIGYLSFNIYKLCSSIYSSIILNVLYVFILKKIFLQNNH